MVVSTKGKKATPSKVILTLKIMIPGIGTLINSFAVIGVGILTRFFVKKEIKNFENNLLPLGLLVLTLGIRSR